MFVTSENVVKKKNIYMYDKQRRMINEKHCSEIVRGTTHNSVLRKYTQVDLLSDGFRGEYYG